MKNFTKCPRTHFTNVPYLLKKTDIDEKLFFATSPVRENILVQEGMPSYIDAVCDIQPHSDFKNVTVHAQYRNELNEAFVQTSFNLYNNNSIDMNGIVSHIDIIIAELILPNNVLINEFKPRIVYTKSFPSTTKQLTLNVVETENCSGFDTLSNVYHFGGCFKPNMPLSDIQPYLFYVGHLYNGNDFISIISASEFLNSKNDLLQSPYITFESLATLYDDIVNGKISFEFNNKKYQSVFATKNTLTNSKFTVKFKAI